MNTTATHADPIHPTSISVSHHSTLEYRTREPTPSPMPDRDEHDHTSVPESADLGSLFDVLVVKNDRVCSECFTRLARREPFPTMAGHDYAAILSYVETVVPDEAKWDILDRRYYERVQIAQRTDYAYPPTDEPTSGGTTACRNCGTTAPYRTLSTPRPTALALDHARSLSDTLTEYGVDHDTDVLLTTVTRLKRDPDWTSRDHDIFAQAVGRAIRTASDSLADPDPDPTTDPEPEPEPTPGESEGDR